MRGEQLYIILSLKSRSFCPSRTNEKERSSVDGIQLLLYVWQSTHAVTQTCQQQYYYKIGKEQLP